MQKWKHNFAYYNNNFKTVNNTIRNLEEYYILSEHIVFLLPLTLVFFRTTRRGFLHFADSATGCFYINTGYVTLPFFTSRDKICNIVVTVIKQDDFHVLPWNWNFCGDLLVIFFLRFPKTYNHPDLRRAFRLTALYPMATNGVCVTVICGSRPRHSTFLVLKVPSERSQKWLPSLHVNVKAGWIFASEVSSKSTF